jgi:hypothetical protein
VTWVDDIFVEGEDLDQQIFQSDQIIDWESDHRPIFDVVLNADDSIRCRAAFDDTTSSVFPTRNLSKMVSK